MMRKLSVMALDTPVRDQPVACVIGCRNTASDIIAPTATQLISAPMATITHPYLRFMPIVVRGPVKSTSGRIGSAMELVRASGEGIDHRIGDLVEKRLEELRQGQARELLAHRKLDLAGAVDARVEASGGVGIQYRSL